MSLESAYNTIEKLVEDFKANEKHYLSASYSESQVRIDFIDKFLIALGWDVNHDIQKNPYEQEVKVERGIDMADARKRADYSFALAPNYRDTVFFVEAKKPAKNLYNAGDYFQAIRYGWNAENPIVVLTDFEEFHIIDSRSKPNIKNIKFSLDKRIKSYHYSDYTNKEKFQEIYYLFSREAVAENSLTKFAETLPKPKGKASQKGLFAGAYKSLDDAFLEELDEIRNILARAFKKSNPTLDSEALTEATQRVIDRIVFIRFLEDKLIEGETHIDKYGEKSHSAWQDFINDSKQLNAKYNGVVFKEHFIDRMKSLPLAKGEYPQGEGVLNPPDDNVFKTICEDICITNSPYLFNYFPIHILGSIYERFLGKIVVATAKQVRIEEKPEVRKAGGVYYTPQYIVQYIVENTVGKLIEGKTPKEISKLSFADISCGSGSFLITVYDTVLHYIAKWYQQKPTEAEKAGCILKNAQWVLSLNQKKEILLNNVFGVDIDNQAVEVTQLSLFLKLLEDETLASIQQGELFTKAKVLPDLSKNIVCGNSLIGTDINTGNMFPSEEEKKINAMNFKDRFPEIMKRGGFDAIVGNPPWGSKDILDKVSLIYLSDKFKRSIHNLNIFALFIDKSLKLIYKNGMLGLLIPKNFIKTSSYIPFRFDILINNSIERITDHGKFPGVAQECISIYINMNADSKMIMRNIYSTESNVELSPLKLDSILKDKFYVITLSTTTNSEQIIEKMLNNSFPLGQQFNVIRGLEHGRNGNLLLCTVCNNYTEKPGKKNTNLKIIICKHCKSQIYVENIKANHVFISKNKINKTYNPLIMGNSIDRYELKEIPYYAETGLKGIDYKNLDKIEQKLLFIRIAKTLRGYFDENQIYALNALNIIYVSNRTPYSLKYLLGLLNSKLFARYCDVRITSGAELTIRFSNEIMRSLPIHEIDFKNNVASKQHDNMVELVQQLLDNKMFLKNSTTDKDKTFYENKCNSLDRQIDRLVYELYGLTEEEIKIVEGEN